MMHAAALALVLSLAPDAGTDALRVLSVSHASALGDDGRTYELDGGAWLSDEVLLARAKDLERLSAENARLREQPPPAPPLAVTLLVVAAVGIGFALGIALPHP